MTIQRFTPARVRGFRDSLLAWLEVHKRDLPWRRTSDPYAIWVSEIMLQQTRVAAVLDHYANWMRLFPTVETLAAASEDKVLTAWSGLGYYRRARFLHQGAKVVAAEHSGTLPRSSVALRMLPGIGAYTSAAIASIAFGEAAAVVDGNVERVLLRQTGSAEAGTGNLPPDVPILKSAEIQKLASLLIDPARPGDFNQAMMELGATICLPRNPLCLQCPVHETCLTRGEHPTATRKASRSLDICYGLVQRQRNGVSEVLVEQRGPTTTVMPGMWDLPGVEADAGEKSVIEVRHAIMQTNYRVKVVQRSESSELNPSAANLRRWVAVADLPSLPLTGLSRKIFLRVGLLVRR